MVVGQRMMNLEIYLKMGVSSVKSLHNEFKNMIRELEFSIEDALMFVTSNVAKGLGIYPKKGCIYEDSDADILLMDKNFENRYSYSKWENNDRKQKNNSIWFL